MERQIELRESTSLGKWDDDQLLFMTNLIIGYKEIFPLGGVSTSWHPDHTDNRRDKYNS